MSSADPYVIRIPERISNSDGTPSQEFLAWLDYDNRWKHDIWQQLGGGSDQIVLSNEELDVLRGSFSKLSAELKSFKNELEDVRRQSIHASKHEKNQDIFEQDAKILMKIKLLSNRISDVEALL